MERGSREANRVPLEDSARTCGNKAEGSLVEASIVSGHDVHHERHDPQQSFSDPTDGVSEEDLLRANVYGLLARMLAAPPSDETLEIVRGLAGANDGTAIGAALDDLGGLAAATPRAQAEDEFTRLFYGFGAGGEITPTASFYLTGFLNEKPLADLRDDLAALGVSASGFNKEPEDHIAFLCETMHGLITGAYHGGAGLGGQKSFFQKHLAPWAARMFEDIEGAEAAALYAPIGTVGKYFMAVEAEAFEMAA